MYEVKLSVDIDDPSEAVQRKLDELLPQAASSLAALTLAHIKEQANNKLHSSRRLYVENLRIRDPKDDGSILVELLEPAHWIEDGRPAGSMVDDLLGGPTPAKVAKDGTLYKVIPFRHNAPPTQMTPSQQNLREVVQRVFKETGRPWGQPSQYAERLHAEGKPGAGERLSSTRIDKLDIMDEPIRRPEGDPGAPKGAGNPQGHGPVGQVVQGPTGIPYLQGIKVYQNEIKTNDGGILPNPQRDVMTFRIVSEKHRAENRWMHPGTEARNFFAEAQQWAQMKWDTELKPMIEKILKEMEGQ